MFYIYNEMWVRFQTKALFGIPLQHAQFLTPLHVQQNKKLLSYVIVFINGLELYSNNIERKTTILSMKLYTQRIFNLKVTYNNIIVWLTKYILTLLYR